MNSQNSIVDEKMNLLITAGAANCEPCLNMVVPNLIEARVSDDDIKKAVEIGKAVKERVRAQTEELAMEILHKGWNKGTNLKSSIG